MLEHALALEADYLATGHYARVKRNGHGAELWRAIDPAKDQSYVLYTLGQPELARTIFPVGEYRKDEIRRLARKWCLPNADKPDSADICFIPSGDYRAFVRERVAARPGAIVDTAGRRLAEHAGVVNYTIGQRRGVPARGGEEPLFVIDIEPATDTVVVGRHEELLADGLLADELSFISGETPVDEVHVLARIRYRGDMAPAILRVNGENAEVHFERPQRAVTPGQAVVFYDADRVLGGGAIVSRL